MASDVVTAEIIRDTRAPHLLTAVPADGSYLSRIVEAIDLTLIEESSEIDGAATVQEASVQGPGGIPVSGEWTIAANHLVFTPDIPLSRMDLIPSPFTQRISPSGTRRLKPLPLGLI